MPYKLVEPKPGRSPHYRVRGTEFGVYLDRSAQTGDRRKARELLAAWRDEAHRLALSGAGAPAGRLTFAEAAISYMQSGRSRLFLAPLIAHFGETPVDAIGQAALDEAAAVLGPDRKPQTNNRLVYTPTLAILKHSGFRPIVARPPAPKAGRVVYLGQDEAFALLDAATATDARLGALMTFLLYCGPRLSEALRLQWRDVDLEARSAVIGITKNGLPIAVNLPTIVVTAMANLDRTKKRVFGLAKHGRLYAMLTTAEKRSGVALPPGSAFHVLRHTHAVWRRRQTGADTSALVATGLWKSHNAARVYEHFDVSEESRKSDLLPTPKRVKPVRKAK
ncbi:phage integrase family protein [Roseiarcus fermentans]|uniref:Phage integrase family protein n=1 Tax=Roseiarcus fermentans TaxID=1473586 RepID=A0A366EFB2_9HYPH|nr:tyrosine-type recombinase/integrase [Roseiarcus fermentans]RBP01082.1 phage integrase family protein [Roseiarcus fermentans]